MARPIAKDHDAKRAHILCEAAVVFARDGIARASMAQVAKACGISKANIYHYYESKDALLFDILDSYLMALRDCMAALALVGLSPRAQLLLFVTETLLAYDGMDAEHKIQTEGIASLEPAKQNILRNYQRDMVRQLSDILGQCAPDLAQDPKRLQATAMSVFGMLNWFYMWQPKADHAARKDYAGLVTGLVMDGAR